MRRQILRILGASARRFSLQDRRWLVTALPVSLTTAGLLLQHHSFGAATCEARPKKVALVTGSSSGIGKAIAERLAGEGYQVVINSRSSIQEGKALAATLPGAVYIQADCSSREGCEGLIQEVAEKCGQLDLLICNAGVGKVIPHDKLELIDDEYMQKIFALNCFGPLWLSRAAMPHLKKAEEASIIMIGSAAGGRPMGSSIPYSMTRAAMNHLTKLLAKSQGPVRVNCVAPGLIETRITDGNEWDGSHAAVKTHTPLKRVGQPVDLTEAVLCCIRSRYMTGQIIYVDGGASLVF